MFYIIFSFIFFKTLCYIINSIIILFPILISIKPVYCLFNIFYI
nr:MAG TPA: hypothetical protein [Caudoviricetes sp.]